MSVNEAYKKLVSDDANLEVGKEVIVRWGYGAGFRAQANGVITKIYPKSVRVKIIHDVPFGDTIGWKEGFELKGIPRYQSLSLTWDYWNSVELI